MHSSDFVHLHVHSDYSLLDGACKTDRLAETAKAQGMKALALTDHGNMFGVIEFYRKVQEAGVKPIIGFEAYVAPGSRFDREVSAAQGESALHHLTLLARNEKGYHNLIKLTTAGYLEGFYYKPRIDKALLAEHSHGLIGMSGCLGGEVAQLLLADRYDEARKVAGFYADLFGKENYFLEVMDNGLAEQKRIMPAFVRLGAELGVRLVATNDVHYLTAADALAHQVLLCINTGKFLEDEKKLSFDSDQYYFRTPEEMAELFKHLPEALANTKTVAEMCNLELFFKEKHLPKFQAASGVDNDTLFEKLCREGFRERYGEASATGGDVATSATIKEAAGRLEHEMGVIRRMGFVSFFLIAWDLIRKSREMGVPVGPGRGSAVGSIVSYCLKITNVDPLRYELLFERFMSEKRNEAPDIDIDFCQDGRERVLEYVREKYGSQNVAQIITFGTMAARAVLRDVSRVLRYPLDRTDLLTKMVPAAIGVTLASALTDSPDLASAYENDPEAHRVIDIAKRLEGLARHASTHAAGVVLGDKPLTEYVPLARMQKEITTQYDMESLEKIGLVKIDFLGLKTLSVLDRAVKTIRAKYGVDVDLDHLDLEDPKTYEMLARGESMGVFQMESGGFAGLLKRLRPDRFADLIALVALYRPGPLGGGMVDSYVNRKHGTEPIEYDHPLMEQILASTYGVMVYQDQVMRLVNRLGGIELSDAYTLVKAIGKKRGDYIEARRPEFVEGAVKNGLDRKKAENLFEQIEYFGGYGFNQSHSTAYALIAFQTAFLKCHHPAAFMAALLTYEMNDTDKLAAYVEECRKTLRIEILPPDVNRSESAFTVEEKAIRFGLAGVKGVGEKAVESIVAARTKDGPFKSFFDFCTRVDQRSVNRGVVEALIRSGAFDSLGARRSQYTAVLDRGLAAGQSAQADRLSGQKSFFDQMAGDPGAGEVKETLPDIPEWSEQEILSREKATLGFYLTSHPLARYSDVIARFSNVSTDRLRDFEDGTEVSLGAMVSDIRYTFTRNGKSQGERMAIVKLEDLSGSCEAVFFPRELAKNEPLIRKDAVLFVRGAVSFRREPPSIKVSEVVTLSDAPQRLTESVTIRLEPRHQETRTMEELKQALKRHHGSCPVMLELIQTDGPAAKVRTDSSLSVTPDETFTDDVDRVLGAGHVVPNALKPRKQAARNGGRPWPRS